MTDITAHSACSMTVGVQGEGYECVLVAAWLLTSVHEAALISNTSYFAIMTACGNF
jgi:hypothetical protein